jgi:hypothetical protein
MDTENSNFIPADDEQETLENRVIRFSVNDQRIAEAKEEFKDVDAYKDLDAAKKAKAALTKMRTALGDAHKEAKAEALAYGRRCDAEKNRLLELIGEIEDPITEQLNDIKNAAKREEEQRLALIEGGIEQIQAFALDRHDLTFDQLTERLDTLLALKVDPDFYAERTEDAENAKEVAESKLRIAIINEEARLKEVEEQERVRKENEELRKQLAKSQAEQAERDKKAAAEQAAKDAERKAELDKQAEELAAAQAEIDAEKKRQAEEQRKKEEAEAEAKAKAIAALQAPDKQKLLLYATDIHTLVNNRPVLQSDAANNILLDVIASLVQVESFIESKSEEL